jgi:hypothetical protein
MGGPPPEVPAVDDTQAGRRQGGAPSKRFRGVAVIEVGAVGLLLAIVAAGVYGPQAIHGGFLSDAWTNRGLYVFSEAHGFFGRIGELLGRSNIAPRPLQAVYLVVLNGVFGAHVGWWLGWQLLTNVWMCLTLFLLLRRLSLSPLDAGAVALLVLVFPAASSVRFWLATIWAPLSIGLVCTGFLLALMGFEAQTRKRALLLHALSLGCFVGSLLLYEIALLIMLSSVLLYWVKAHWRPAVGRWMVDCVVLLTIALTVTAANSSGHMETEVGVWGHGKAIADQTRILLTTVILPFNSANWYILLLLALVPAGSLLAWRLLPEGDPAQAKLRKWLIVMAGGLWVVVLGYAIYAPGTDYYAPLGPGIADRVNVVPSIGWVLMLYAGFMLVAILVTRGLPRPTLAASALAATGCCLIAVGWLQYIHNYSAYYTRAYEEDLRVLATMKIALPNPRSDSTIWTFGQPVEVVPGVPIFGNTWDMTSSVQLTYQDPSISSYVAYPETGFKCEPRRMTPDGPRWNDSLNSAELARSRYGRTYFIDTNTGTVLRIDSPAQCRKASGEFVLSPEYPPQ